MNTKHPDDLVKHILLVELQTIMLFLIKIMVKKNI